MLVVVVGTWLFLVVVGCCWLLLVGCWFVVVCCCWVVLSIVVCCCIFACCCLVDLIILSSSLLLCLFCLGTFCYAIHFVLTFFSCFSILSPFLLSPNRLFVAGGTDPNIERRLGMWHESASRDCGHVQRVAGHHLFFEVRQILLLIHVATAPCTIDTSKYRIKTPIKITKRQAWNILGRVTHTSNISCFHL